jgi:putative ATP-binding cassette transporter
MQVLTLLIQQTTTSIRRLGLMAVIAGLANAGVLAVVNAAASHVQQNEIHTHYVLLFAIVIFAYVYAQRYVLFTTTQEVEAIVHRIRLSLIDSVRACELQSLEYIGRSAIFAGIDRETQTISQTANVIVITFQAVILIFFTAAYIAIISLTSFLLATAFVVFALLLYVRKMKQVNRVLHEATERENDLHDALASLVEGFKEVKLNSRRSADLHDDLVNISERAASLRAEAQEALNRNFIFSQVSFFFLLGTMVFIVPMLSETYSDVVTKSTTAVLFIIGPISTVVANVPVFAMANTAAENLTRLQKLLAEHAASTLAPGVAQSPRGAGRRSRAGQPAFKEIALRGVSYQFPAQTGGFRVGPVDFTLCAGDLVFLTGGNGSGKSTLLRLLTGLYLPQAGAIALDGVVVTPDTLQGYRDIYAAVFSDFYLFHKLYGLLNVDPDEVKEWLERLEIADKTSLQGDSFETIKLSSGQRKRLALLIAILEKRPVLILDEWAADQDPVFRRKFYYELLPELRERSYTILAVTHDDRYFELADRRLHMEEGRLAFISQEKTHHDDER